MIGAGILWLSLPIYFVMTLRVLQIVNPNFTAVPGKIDEYVVILPNYSISNELELLFELVCYGPVLMKWNLSRHMVTYSIHIY